MKHILSIILTTFTLLSQAQTHEYVDLGLPSGTLWATCNLGAENPWDCSNMYSFTEIDTLENYMLNVVSEFYSYFLEGVN